MHDSTSAENPVVRVTSAPYDDASLLGVTAERIADGMRVLLLRDSMTIREGKDLTARLLGKSWSRVRSNAYVT